MIHAVLSTVTLAAVGAAFFRRRKSWRCGYMWQQVLTLGVVLQGIGFLLCSPIQSKLLGQVLLAITGTSHMDDYLGHLAFLAAVSCVICAVAYRLVPKADLERFLVWIEAPGALASTAMLLCITFSRRTHPRARIRYLDFFDVPLDTWLSAYWLIYGGAMLYLLGVLIWLLVVLRHNDKRSRLSSDLFIAAAALGLASTLTRIADVLMPSLHIPNEPVWALMSAAIAFSSLAASLSWRNARISR